MACDSCEVTVNNLVEQCNSKVCVDKMKEYNITSLPAVAVNLKLAGCCRKLGAKSNWISKVHKIKIENQTKNSKRDLPLDHFQDKFHTSKNKKYYSFLNDYILISVLYQCFLIRKVIIFIFFTSFSANTSFSLCSQFLKMKTLTSTF